MAGSPEARLLEEVVVPSEVETWIERMELPGGRRRVLARVLAERSRDPDRLNLEAWQILVSRDRPEEEYRHALRKARAAVTPDR